MTNKLLMLCAVLMLVAVLVGAAGCTSLNSNSNPSTASTPAVDSATQGANTSTNASNPATTTQPTNLQSYSFVGSKNSNVYHYLSCYEAKKIKSENLVTFNTLAEACAAGYRACKVCNPPACGATPSPTPTPTPTPVTPKVATTTQVWAPPVNGPDTIANPGPGMGANIPQGTDWWYCRAVVNAADGTHPCGLANWYIDNQAAGGVWSNNAPGVNGMPGCTGGMGGGFAKLELHSADTSKLSVGYHTLKCDYLGDSKYAPSEWVGRIYVAPPPTPTSM